jgi:5-methyltetrahydropteroyltriglutamate--homocysteine methyltransferase
MKRSTTRILTTHTGSLPRPPDLVELMLKKDQDEPVDEGVLDERVRTAVLDVVRRQAESGIDVISDGEFGKVGFNNYVKDRFTGFGGEQTPWRTADIADFPEFAQRQQMLAGSGGRRRNAPTCIGPVAVKDPDAVRKDVANLKAALAAVGVEEAFIPATSPGSVALIINNQYYPSQEAYLYALADALRYEYQAIVDAGFILQLDSPDLGMCGHIQYADAGVEEFRKAMALHIEALNHALAGLPEDRLRIHLCWGNYAGPHHRDRPLSDIVAIVLKARVQGISYEAANPRHEHEWRVWEDVKLPDGKVLIPGVIDSCNTYIEHPRVVADRIVRVARIVGRENVIAATDCGFGTFVGFGALVPSIAWAKLGSLVEGARLASAELWP